MSRKESDEYIIRRECDEPMARSKNLLPCKRDCKNCMACIEVTDTGLRHHCTRHSGDLKRVFIETDDEIEEVLKRIQVMWTKEEEELLLKLYRKGWTRKDIANRMNRTPASVSRKLLRLGQNKEDRNESKRSNSKG